MTSGLVEHLRTAKAPATARAECVLASSLSELTPARDGTGVQGGRLRIKRADIPGVLDIAMVEVVPK